MSYYDEDFYYEPSEFDQQVDEFKQSLLLKVRDEYKTEMDKLRKENTELQKIKNDWKNIQNEYAAKHRQLEFDRKDLLSKVRRERLDSLIEDFTIEIYKVDYEFVFPEKCNKCNDKRKIEFNSPSGKKLYEDCQCSNGSKVFIPEPHELKEFSLNRDGNKLSYWFAKKYEDSDHFHTSHYMEMVYQDDMTFETINRYSICFRSKEDCQKYCDWLTENKKE